MVSSLIFLQYGFEKKLVRDCFPKHLRCQTFLRQFSLSDRRFELNWKIMNVGYMLLIYIVVLAQPNTLFFCTMIFFTFQAQSFFKQAAISLSFLPNRQPLFSFSPFQFYPLQRGQLFFMIRFFISLLFKKPLFPINRQFRIDSYFLDWEGHHWDFRLTRSS